ncbi:Aryl-sulfate sulfohydrolase [Planctomycetales bacterium 10988]|nr:Aryl-sulfate sulfohydrolase [Planctomycetales bacterium 10988]
MFRNNVQPISFYKQIPYLFSWVGIFLTSSFGSLFQANVDAQTPKRPNIVYILADDLGWTDIGSKSDYYETPNIDRLAKQGMTFTSFYSSQNCAPTRACIMSGQYAPRTDIYTVGTFFRGQDKDRKMVPPENGRDLPLEKTTLADVLNEAGYVTGMFGKWHLGNGEEYHPSMRGFDEALVSNGRHFRFKTTPPSESDEDEYLADFLTDKAVDFIDRHQDETFFLYLPHFAVHVPLAAKEDYIKRFEKKPVDEGHNHATYAAMIASVDDSVGRVMDQLEKLNLTEETLLLFSSDNGGVGGYLIPGTDQRKGTTDNQPLRGGKGMLYEGGIRVPTVAAWPGVIPAGSSCDEVCLHVDLLPTFADLAEASVPVDYPLDGVSFASLLSSPKTELAPRYVYWHFPGYLESYIPEDVWRTTPVSVIRGPRYKLLEFFEDPHLELYDLQEDLGETTNLAEEKPELAAQMLENLHEWQQAIGAKMARPKTAEELANPQPTKQVQKGKGKGKNKRQQKQ